MEARIDPYRIDFMPKYVKYLASANKVVDDSPLSATVGHLVRIRASQINGCTGCLDMHTKDAAAAGETAVRLNLVACWRDATVFTEAERAALELTEQGTRLADAGDVTDEVWANAAKHYSDEELFALVSLIALINAFNRLNVITRQPGGDYRPGQFAHVATA
jgi:AhpD family alkylhydroperoxidase